MKIVAHMKDLNALVAELNDKYFGVRETAANALGNLRDRKAVEPLGELLVNESHRPLVKFFEASRVSKAASRALVKIEDPRTADFLAQALYDNYGECNVEVAVALAEFGDPRAFEPLIGEFTRQFGVARARIAEALGRLGDSRAVDLLQRGLIDDTEEVRRQAQEALKRLGASPARSSIVSTSTDLIFLPECPLCHTSLGEVSRPRGILTSGTTFCLTCKGQLSMRVSPDDNRLYVRMLTVPLGLVDPGETVWETRSDFAGGGSREIAPRSEVMEPGGDLSLTTGVQLRGERSQVSTLATKVDRAGKCCDCKKVIQLVDAREVCLDWDGVDAYHFYCPTCHRGTDDENYYKGRLLGADGSQVIDQHAWYYN